jgi:hypothetical protein
MAVEARRSQFFGSYVDKGAIPYGHHGAAATDDSNGKNTGVAYALKLLGDKHGAKYFAMMSTHASFTRRGGHGHDWFWHWSPWAATLCGPQGTIAMTTATSAGGSPSAAAFDGGFVSNRRPGHPEPSATRPPPTCCTTQAPLKQTLITGKDPDEDDVLDRATKSSSC